VLFNSLDSPIAVAFAISSIFLLAAICLALRRIFKGPTAFDRVLALDMIGGVCICLIVLFAIFFEQQVLLDAAFGISLVSFLGTVAFARYLAREGGDQ
jgi:multicomponent Na+:H+ antiporter subunit F